MRNTGPPGSHIHGELEKMHGKMVELFQVDFTYFKDVKILGESEFRELLTERIWLNLYERGVSYTGPQWTQIKEYLSGEAGGGLFTSMAFYSEREEVLYISQNLVLDHPEKVIPVCVHELAEKMVSTLIAPLSVKGSAEDLPEKRLYTSDLDKTSPEEFLNRYKEAAFKSVFKEGCCEAIALKTLRHSGLKDSVESMETELQKGHAEWISVLQSLEDMKAPDENQPKYVSQKDGVERIEYEKKLITAILKSSQVIKCVSYHLGYPVAKEIIERHGVEGVKAALKNPPLKAKYFLDPSTYVSSLGTKNMEEVKK